ncbi:MAG: glycolate oxidase subunit GlcE [Granulosicoccus sp.]
MSGYCDSSELLRDQVAEATESQSILRIAGGNSKASLGNAVPDTPEHPVRPLSTRSHCGIISYEPTELVVTVRSGTALQSLNAELEKAGQMLPFEPPELPDSTIGGVLACGFSGPRRPFSGSARDYVLGVRVINGAARDLSFGGQVMKNVAGYDVSRLQIGAWGTLGVMLDISMKVLPKPEVEMTLVQESAPGDTAAFATFLRRPLPLSGALLIGRQRYFRLSGSEAAVRAAALGMGGDSVEHGDELWRSVRDHTHEFFTSPSEAGKTLWRISVADHAPALSLSGDFVYDWAGAQRWLLSDEPADNIFEQARALGGHAMRFGPGNSEDPAFQPLNAAMLKLQSRLRDSFDPQRLFNRGLFHPELDQSLETNR